MTKGKIDYNQYLDQVIENGEKQSLDFSRFQMIVDMYCHEIESGYQKLMTARDDINKIVSAHKMGYKAGDINGEKYVVPYTLAMKNLDKLGSSFKKEIAEHAKQT